MATKCIKRKPLKKSKKKALKKNKRNSGTRKSTILNKRRKGLGARIIPWIKRFGSYLALIVFIAWVCSWIWFSGSLSNAAAWVQNRTITQSAALGFTVKNILLEGRINSNPKAIRSALGVKKGDVLFGFNPNAAQAKIIKMPWIRSVHIERRLPDTVYIKLEERLPVALISKNDTISILDDLGEVIPDKNLTPFKALIIVHGKDASTNAPEFIKTLSGAPLLFNATQQATWVGQRRWDINLKNGTTIHLPDNDIGLALTRLSDAHESDDLLGRPLKSIDLREPKRIVIRPILGEKFERDAPSDIKKAPAI